MFVRPVFVTFLAAAILVPAIAWAGFPGSYLNEYEARVEGDPTAGLGFDVHRVGGQKVADKFDLGNVPFSCHDGSSARVAVPFGNAALPVEHGSFEGKVRTGAAPPFILKIQGEVQSSERAKGVMSLRTRGAFLQEACYSGLLGWRDSG